MLAKKSRADKKAVEKVFKEGRFLNSEHLTFKFVLNKEFTTPQISFVAPKTVAKLAVKRNLLRRKGYSALSEYIAKIPANLTGVFIFKKYQDDISILENEIKNILSKVH